jgi:hypothetical protein
MDRLANFRGAYHELEHRVQTVVLRDENVEEEIRALRGDILRFTGAADRVRSIFPLSLSSICSLPFNLKHIDVFPGNEYDTLRRSISDMLEALSDALHRVQNPPQDMVMEMAIRQRTGKRGRPRIDIDQRFLRFALETRGPAEISRLLGCCARTVRRRAVEYRHLPTGDAPFGPPIVGGRLTRRRDGPIIRTQLSHLSSESLDRAVASILRHNPDFGRRMIDGQLRSWGVRVSRGRIERSYLRVHGPPPGFLNRNLRRRRYRSEGVNSVWHHDGQHGNSLIILDFQA